MDVQQITDRVMSQHKRKVSQLAGLETEFGLHFDEAKAKELARKTMKQLHPNQTTKSSHAVAIDAIVSKARKEHRRKVSQFTAIRDDIAQYLPDPADARKMAAEVMREVNPNDRSGKASQISIDRIYHNAMTKHRRKVSQFRAMEAGLAEFQGFTEADVKSIARDMMKAMFAQKAHLCEVERKQEERAFRHVRADSVKAPDLFGDHAESSDEEDGDDGALPNKRRGSVVFLDDEALAKRKARAEWTRKESVATPNLFGGAEDDDDEAMAKREARAGWRRKESMATPNIFGGDDEEAEDVDGLRYEIGRLKSALSAREKEIEWMREVISDLTESKTELAIQCNRCMEQMREYLLHYQRSLGM